MLFSKNVDFLLFMLLFIIIVSIFVTFSPLHPYGDDYNLSDSILSYGVWGSILNWSDHYGIAYRPFGSSLLFILYFLYSSGNVFLTYLLHFILVVLFFTSLFKLLLHFGFSSKPSFYSILFVFFFPLNFTSYFQISSASMFVSGILFIFSLLSINYYDNKRLNFPFISIISFLSSILFYEQTFALIPIYLYFSYANFYAKRPISQFLVFLALIFITITFYLYSFFTFSNNPKIVTVVDSHNPVINTIPLLQNVSKVDILLTKIIKTTDFFIHSINIFWSHYFIFCMFLLFAFSAIFIYLKDERYQQLPYRYMFLSFLMMLLPFAPFFLYKDIPIPNYVFVIPSIGVSIFTYFIISRSALISRLFFIPIFIFFIISFSYVHSLKSFLDKAYHVVTATNNYYSISSGNFVYMYDSSMFRHIFWLEKSFLRRILDQNLNHDLSFTVSYDKIIFYPKDEV